MIESNIVNNGLILTINHDKIFIFLRINKNQEHGYYWLIQDFFSYNWNLKFGQFFFEIHNRHSKSNLKPFREKSKCFLKLWFCLTNLNNSFLWDLYAYTRKNFFLWCLFALLSNLLQGKKFVFFPIFLEIS